MKIKQHFTSVAHPQANGQVEVTNQEIGAILTIIVHLHHRDWNRRLPRAIWAYRTTWKTTLGFTPFKLLYGKVAMLPIEFEHKTLCTTLDFNISLPAAQQERLLYLNSLDEIRKRALERTYVSRYSFLVNSKKIKIKR